MKVNDSLQVYGPGHHTLFSYAGEDYILYHRHRLPFVKGTAYRQTCISKLTFDEANNEINKIIPYHTQLFPDLAKEKRLYIQPETITGSSSYADYAVPGKLTDRDYGTRWEPADEDKAPVLTVLFDNIVAVDTMEVRFEYPWEKYFMKVEISSDNNDWTVAASARART